MSERVGPNDSDDDRTVVDVSAPTSQRAPRDQVPTAGARMGRYVLLEEVGSGGMGVVMAAWDRELDRRVALKLLRPDLSRSGEVRMKREAQALAQLQHPSVVTVYEVGAHQGQLYIAMEYVDGETLERWAARQRGQWRRIVEMAVRAGRGVAAAHAVGLVHRDIKPSNVLVSRDGRARMVDFGIATAVGPGPAEDYLLNSEAGRAYLESSSPGASSPRMSTVETARVPISMPPATPSSSGSSGSMAAVSSAAMVGGLGLTEVGVVVGTPAYMAPEQHRGLTVDARSDQFALCVTLYRVLYDDVPFAGSDLEALRQAVCQGVVKPPPAGSSVPPAVRRVLLRGMAVDPERRWPSVTALLDALERTVGRRRRWIGLGMVGLGTVAAVGLASMESTGCPPADERLAGVWDDDRVVAVRDAFVATELPYALDTWTRTRERLDRHAIAWSDRYAQVCAAMIDPVRSAAADLEMACLRERREELHALVELLAGGDANLVAKAPQAAAELEPVARCLGRGTEAAQMASPPPDKREAIDEIRLVLARAEAAQKAGMFEVALERASSALKQAEQVGYVPVKAEVLYLLGSVEGLAGKFDDAVVHLGDANLQAVESRHDRVAVRSATMLAFVLGYKKGQHEAGMTWSRRATAALARLESDLLLEAELRMTRAAILSAQGRYEPALEEFEFGLEEREATLGNNHPTVAASYNNIGGTMVALGRFDEALEALEHARAIWVDTYGPRHPVVATVYNSIAVVLEQTARWPEARDRFEQALAIGEEAFGPDHINLAITLDNLGSVLTRMGQYEEARRLCERGLALRERDLGRRHPHYASSLVNLGLVAEGQGRLEDACDYHRRAITLWEESLGATHPYLGHALTSLGRAELSRGNPEGAQPLLERALKIREQRKALPAELAETRLVLARVLWPREPARARTLAERAQHGMEAAPPGFAEQRAELDRWLAAHPAPSP